MSGWVAAHGAGREAGGHQPALLCNMSCSTLRRPRPSGRYTCARKPGKVSRLFMWPRCTQLNSRSFLCPGEVHGNEVWRM